MRRRRVEFFLLIVSMVIALGISLMNLIETTHAAPPEQKPTMTTVDPSIEKQTEQLGTEAEALIQKGDLKGAINKLNQALLIFRHAGDREGEAFTLFAIGGGYYDLGKKQKALDYYNQALSLLQAIGDRYGEATTLVYIGNVYDDLSEKQKALDYYNQALQLWRSEGNRDGEATTLNNIGFVYSSLGDMQKALDYCNQALLIFQAEKDSTGQALALNNIGWVYYLLSEAHKALDHYNQALSLWRTENDRVGQAKTLNNIGLVYLLLSDYRETFNYYNQALQLFQAEGDSTLHLQAITLNNIGLAYDSLGEEKKALDFYNKALPLLQNRGPRDLEATILNNMGLAYDSLGNEQKALEFYSKALQIFQAIGLRHLEALPLNNIGFIYALRDEYQKGLDYFKQALTSVQAIGNRGGEANLLDNIGGVYLLKGDKKQALDYFNQALRLWRAVGDRSGEAETLFSLGYAHESQGDFRLALDLYQQSIALREDVRTFARLEEFKTGLAERAVNAYQRAILLQLHMGQRTEAFDLSERARVRTFLEQLSSARLDIRKGADAKLIQQEQLLRSELTALDRQFREDKSRAEENESLKTKLATKQREYEDLINRLQLSNPEYVSLVNIQQRRPLTLSQVKKLLDKDTTLLSYFVTPDKTIAFIITQQSFEVVELPVSEKDIEAGIKKFREDGFANLNTVPSKTLEQLYAQLIAPLKSHLKTPVVGIIPHSVLHYLSFAALTDGQRYLGDEHTLFYLPSASTLPFIQSKRKAGGSSLLALAQSKAEGFALLEHANQEVQAVAKLYGTEAIVGNAATESVFSTSAGNYNILHIAAHGQLNQDSPLFSRILLTPDEKDDGSLEVHEVYGLDLKNTNLLVLSACETQLGERSRGDELLGLNRAFIYAGTPTVIASLWSVDDEATGFLMRSFYTHLKQGKSKAEALQQAQRETRTHYPHPYYWAAFVLTGDGGSIGEVNSRPLPSRR